MAIIEDVKCPRCDRKYSGVRSRCPYCGARRVGFGKYSKENDDNARGKMMISVLILAVLTVAAGIMLFTTPSDAVATVETTPTPDPLEDINNLPGMDFNTPTPFATATPTPIPEVTHVEVYWGGSKLSSPNSFTRRISPSVNNGGPLSNFSVRVEPPGLDLEVTIESSDEDIFYIEQTSEGAPYTFTVYPVSSGDAQLIASCGGKEHIVYVAIRD